MDPIAPVREEGIPQHSIGKSIGLHLLPGIPIVLFYALAAPFFIRLGFPPVFTLCLAVAVVLVPVELGAILFLGKRENGNFSLRRIVLYRQPVSWWQFLLFVFVILAWSSVVFLLISKPLGAFLSKTFFSWAPEWFLNGNSFEGSRPVLLITWLMLMVFGNVVGPLVEELYFRGVLLPRISRLKGWAPVLNAFLFSLYHFWSPWEVVTRTLAVLPVCAAAHYKRNIYIGMAAHLLLNTLSSVGLLAVVMG